MKTKIELTEKEIDFNTPQLLISIDGNLVVITTGDNPSERYFEGMAIVVNANTYRIGEHRSDWMKGRFKLFTGKLTLEND